jgi:hypothetical protein
MKVRPERLDLAVAHIDPALTTAIWVVMWARSAAGA